MSKPTPAPPCPRCGVVDARASRAASRWVVFVCFATFLALMWHPLLALIIALAGAAFRMTTRRRICATCGFDGREDTRRGFDLSEEAARQRVE